MLNLHSVRFLGKSYGQHFARDLSLYKDMLTKVGTIVKVDFE